MKKLFLLTISLSILSVAYSRTIILEIPDEDIAIVEHYVEDAEEWLVTAWKNKLESRRNAFIKEELEKLGPEDELPVSKMDLVRARLSSPGYKKRKDRIEEPQPTPNPSPRELRPN